MDRLLRVEKAIVKVEGWLIAICLITMLSLAVYGIVYRNAVVPLVSHLQTSDDAPPAGEVEVAPPPAKLALAPSNDEVDSDFDSDFGADAKPVGGQEPESDFDSDFGDDDAKPAGVQEPESDFDSDFGGGTDAPKSAAAAAKPPGAPVVREESVLVRVLLWLNFDWIEIVMRHLILWLAFLGGAVATQQRKHIAIDALARRMPSKGRPTIAAVVATVSLIVCGALAYAAFGFTALEASHGRPLFGPVPGWMGPAIIPAGFALIGLHYVFRLAEAVAALAGKHELPPDALEVTLQ